MSLDANRWTIKTQEAVQAAISAARSQSHPEVTADHLLAALLGQADEVLLPDNVYGPSLALARAELARWGITGGNAV